MAQTETNQRIAYLGPAGAGLGFQLSGLTVFEPASPDEMLKTLRQLAGEGEFGIIFVDEGLAEPHREAIAKLNEHPLPAIIMLPNPAAPTGAAARNLQQLMVRAIGSDIFSNS